MNTIHRISQLPTLRRCPGLALIQMTYPNSSKAADTGSAAHKLIEYHHKGYSVPDSIAATTLLSYTDFPQADLTQAAKWAGKYLEDPRNRGGTVIADYLEIEVSATLGGDTLTGHVDQIRREHGQLYVWDVKTGREEGSDMVRTYALQIAAYAVAATETLGEPVLPGGIIHLRDYTKRSPGGVFYHAGWSLDGCRRILERGASNVIARINSGDVRISPGPHCGYCPAGGPPNCIDEIEEILDGRNDDD